MQLPWLVLAAVPAAAAVAPHALMLSLHVVQKASTSGALFRQYGSDAVVAVVMGLITLALSGWNGAVVVHFMRSRVRVSITHTSSGPAELVSTKLTTHY